MCARGTLPEAESLPLLRNSLKLVVCLCKGNLRKKFFRQKYRQPQKLYAVKSPDTDKRIIQRNGNVVVPTAETSRSANCTRDNCARNHNYKVDNIFRNECAKKSLTSRNCTTSRKFRLRVLPKEQIQAADGLN